MTRELSFTSATLNCNVVMDISTQCSITCMTDLLIKKESSNSPLKCLLVGNYVPSWKEINFIEGYLCTVIWLILFHQSSQQYSKILESPGITQTLIVEKTIQGGKALLDIINSLRNLLRGLKKPFKDRTSRRTPKSHQRIGILPKEASTAMPVLAWRKSNSSGVASASMISRSVSWKCLWLAEPCLCWSHGKVNFRFLVSQEPGKAQMERRKRKWSFQWWPT